jgi:hypothetical protein
MAKLDFYGANTTIVIKSGITDLDAKIDLYSDWKEWATANSYNAAFPKAISAIGGDPITGTQSVGVTYFLENGWRIQPWEGNTFITVSGNLYTRETGQSPYLQPIGQYRVVIETNRSNLVDQISTGSGVLPSDIISIADRAANSVWSQDISGFSNDTAGKKVVDNLTKIQKIYLDD